ncbi:hypothetical protein EH165_13850 [Nakamurella antarctica]|uniref:Peptidoglycan-binding protein n=1 Tax=Nakamurella antarctica TaxID=1902245 RepID=A0A3G8ZNZ9_9ACTN|nr:hypothetical protein [Nakamurella antarctica]AZI59062.1 hypothetical protein EH165_13850 [Nakamurella antarctica]
MASSRRNILIVAAVAVVTAGGGFAAARLIVSPADAAARTAPPAAGPITAPVERKILNAEIVTRGDIGFDGSVEVKLATGTSATAVVTGRIAEVGSVVTSGSILLEVTGRPVLAMSGELPTYRSLGPGNTGPDVEQLESALLALGFDPGAQDKLYDAATAGAVAALYASLGYESPQPGEDVRAQLISATAAKASADQAILDAQTALSAAAKGSTESARLSLQAAVNSAQAAYKLAQTTPSAPDPTRVAGAQSNLTAAQEYKQYADDGLATALAQGAENVGEWQVAAQKARDGVASAQAALDAANAGGPPDNAAISQALDQLKIAQASQAEGLKPPDTASAQAAVAAAQSAAAIAQTEFAAAQAASATPLPATEVVWLANLPRRVDSVAVERGSLVTKAVMSVSGADLTVRASVSAQEAALLKTGMKAKLTVPGAGFIDAVVSQIGETGPLKSGAAEGGADGSGGAGGGDSSTGSNGSDAAGKGGTIVYLQPQNVTNEQAQALRGINVKITIPVASTAGEVLTVPVAALFSDDKGVPRVEVLLGDGSTRFQKISVGLSTGGDVEVSPISDSGQPVAADKSSLDKGSLVVVGR